MARLTLYKRNKTYWVSGTINGVRIRESTGHASQERARQWAAKRGWELEQEAVFGTEAVFTFGAAVNMYIDAGGEQRYLMPLLDEWERRLVKDIRPGDVIDLANRLYPKAKGSTKNRHVITPMVAVFHHLAKRGKGGKGAPLIVERFTSKAPKRKVASWAWIQAIEPHAEKDLIALILFLASTAARIGEALALEWRDVNLKAGTALLRDTKNGEDREVALLPIVKNALEGMSKSTKATPASKVFRFYDRSHVRRLLITASKRAGIEYVSTHGIGRRLFATTLSRANVDPVTAAKAGGWKSVRMFLEVYAQPDESGKAVEAAIGTALSQVTISDEEKE